MAQSFWTTKEYKEFKTYTKWIEDNYKMLRIEELDNHINNWKKGRAKLTQDALTWGVELDVSTPEFLLVEQSDIIDSGDGITYINPKCEGVSRIGLHRGKCYWEGDPPIFNIDFFHDYISDCETKEEADWKLKLYIKFHGIGEA